MRKVMMAVMAVAVVGLMTPGCSRKGEGKPERESVAEAKIDVAKAKKEQRPDLTRARVDGQKDVAGPRQDAAGIAARERNDTLDPDELSGTGGSGLAAPQDTATQGEVAGTVQAITEKNLTLILPNEEGRLMRFMASDHVPVMRDQQPVTLDSLKAGDEVRASYQVDPIGLRSLRSLEVTKVSEPQPAMRQ